MNTATLPALPVYRLPTLKDNLRALVFAILIHVFAALLMFVGVWSSAPEPMVDAGDPIVGVKIDLSAGPLPKLAAPKPEPAPPKPVPPPPKPEVKPEVKPAPPKPEIDKRVEVGKPDDVTDQKLAPPKIDIDPLTKALEAEQRKQKLAEEKRAQLEAIREERRKAEAESKKAAEALANLQNEQKAKAEAAAKAEREAAMRKAIADEEAAIQGTVQTDDLLAQWRNAVRLSVNDQWQLPTGTPARLQCSIRISAMPGGEVGLRTVVEPCQLPPELQQTLLDAVDAASPLPYSGFESVFQRQLTILFVTPESS